VADPLFLIDNGVRRAVACREAGLIEIRAFVESGGVRGPEFLVRLDQLYSPKDRIERNDPWNRYLDVESAMATDAGRAALPAIQLAPLPDNRVKYFTRLADVVLEL
jgi:hypothetical protein